MATSHSTFILYIDHMHTQYLGVQAPTAEVCIVLEAPSDVNEGMTTVQPQLSR